MTPSWICPLLLSMFLFSTTQTFAVANRCASLTSSPTCSCTQPAPNHYEVKCGLLEVTYVAGDQFDVRCHKHIVFSNDNMTQWHTAFEDEDMYNPLVKLHLVRGQRARILTMTDCDVSNSTGPIEQLIAQTHATAVHLRYMTFHNQRLELDNALLQNITQLTLKDNELEDVSYEMLQAMPLLTRLEIGSNQLQRVAPIALQSLSSLDLSANNISEVSPLAFRALPRLKVIELYTNKISTLDAHLFDGLVELESIELMGNRLSAIAEEIFSTLVNLEKINLSINQLQVLPRDVFYNNTKLTVIRLARNELTTLPRGVFRRNTQVIQITLDQNRISHLDVDTFKGLTRLERLNLEGNLLTALQAELFDSLSALDELLLSGNQIAVIEEHAFFGVPNLQILDLSNNKLAYMNLTVFPLANSLRELKLADNHIVVDHEDHSFLNYLAHIEDVDLSNNNIDYIPNDFMGTKDKLIKLDLSRNSLTEFSFLDLYGAISNVTLSLANNNISIVTNMSWVDALSENTRMYKKLDLTGNPLRCDAWNYDLYRYFKLEMPQLRSAYEILRNLFCAAPELLKGRLLDGKDSINPCRLGYVMSHCPANCSCYHTPSDNSLVVDCTRRNLTTVPMLFVPEGGNYTEFRQICNVMQAPTVKVILKHNHIKFLPQASFININVTVLDVSFNNLSDVTWIPQGLKSLMLDHNYLHRIDKTLLEELKNVTLNNNPWICDCETVPFWMFLSDHEHIPNKMDVRCSNMQRSIIRELSRESLCPTYTRLIVIIGVIIAALILIPAAFLVFFYKYKQEIKVWLFARNLCLWYVREEDLDRDKKYDAFLSFSQKDEDFILDHLLPNLEEIPDPYKVCVHMRNFVPGEYIAKQVAESVLNSRRTIVVLSPAFLESVWGKMEFRAAHTKAITEGIARVIIILFDDLDPNDERIDEELRVYLSTNTYIRWGDPWFWDKLKYALPHRKCLNNAAYVNKRFESVSANLDRMDKINQNVSVVNGGVNSPPVDSLLLKVHPLDINRCISNNTPPAEKGIV